MNRNNKILLIGATILAVGIIVVIPILADTTDESYHMPQLYYYDDESEEYVPWYPPGYDSENPSADHPSDDCPWWDRNGDGAFDWMPHWGHRWSNHEGEESPYRNRHGGCNR